MLSQILQVWQVWGIKPSFWLAMGQVGINAIQPDPYLCTDVDTSPPSGVHLGFGILQAFIRPLAFTPSVSVYVHSSACANGGGGRLGTSIYSENEDSSGGARGQEDNLGDL